MSQCRRYVELDRDLPVRFLHTCLRNSRVIGDFFDRLNFAAASNAQSIDISTSIGTVCAVRLIHIRVEHISCIRLGRCG